MAAVAQAPEAAQEFRDFRHYRRLLLVDDRDEHVPVALEPTPAQLRVRREIARADAEERPARLIVLKARRVGISTITQATFAHRAFTRANFRSLTVAHDDEASAELHSMTEAMYDHLPEGLRPQRVAREQGRRLYLDNGSRLRVQTAGNRDIGRAAGFSALHLAEVAFWPDADKALRSVLSTVQPRPGTLIVIESTANGVGNPFHNEWKRAEKGRSDFVPVFIAWFDDPKCVMEGEPLGELDDEERELEERFGLSDAQLRWWRWAVENLCGGDRDTMHQEYPSWPEQAFLTSGRRFYPDALVRKMRTQDPHRRGELVLLQADPGRHLTQFRDDPTGPFHVYQTPERDHRYVAFCDAAGVLREREYAAFESKRDAEDYTAIWVVDRTTFRTVAVWHARTDLSLVATECAKIGAVYNNAIVAPEANSTGQAVIAGLMTLGYGNIYRRRKHGSLDAKVAQDYGWHTNVLTRPLMLESLRDVLRAEEAEPRLFHEELVSQLETFVVQKNGVPHAATGCHDDLVLAAGGAYAVVRDMPHIPRDQKLPRSPWRPIEERAVHPHEPAPFALIA